MDITNNVGCDRVTVCDQNTVLACKHQAVCCSKCNKFMKKRMFTVDRVIFAEIT